MSEKTKVKTKLEEDQEEKTKLDALSELHNINNSIILPGKEEDTKFEIVSTSAHQFSDQTNFQTAQSTALDPNEEVPFTESLLIPISRNPFKNEQATSFNAEELFSDTPPKATEEAIQKTYSLEINTPLDEKIESEEKTVQLEDIEPFDLETPEYETSPIIDTNKKEATIKSEELVDLPSLQEDLPELQLDALKPTDEEDLSRSLMQQEEINENEFFKDITPHETKEEEPLLDQEKPKESPQAYLPAFKEAVYPFTLCIDGMLEVYEKEKLLDILAKFNLGIREIDLQPQFDSQKILLPRLSEYACIYIAQHLRDAKVIFKMGPSDKIFSTSETKNDSIYFSSKTPSKIQKLTQEDLQVATKIPLFQSSTHPEGKKIKILGSLSVNHTIHSPHETQIKRSDDYAETLEALTKELQHKAYYKGADMILNFTVSLQPLKSPGLYKMLLLGVAIKTLSESR